MPIQREVVGKDDHDMQWTYHNKTSSISIDNIKIIITKLVPISKLTVVFWCKKEEINDVEHAKNVAFYVIEYLHAATKILNIRKMNYVVINLKATLEILKKMKNKINPTEMHEEITYLEKLRKEKWSPKTDEIKTQELILHQ